MGDGALAGQLFLAGAVESAGGDRVLAALHQQRDSLHQLVTALRRRQDTMTAADYDAELERLLVEIALLSRRIREREQGTQP